MPLVGRGAIPWHAFEQDEHFGAAQSDVERNEIPPMPQLPYIMQNSYGGVGNNQDMGDFLAPGLCPLFLVGCWFGGKGRRVTE